MKNILKILVISLCMLLSVNLRANNEDRDYWVNMIVKIIDPVFQNLSQNKLRANMPVETNEGLDTGKRKEAATLK